MKNYICTAAGVIGAAIANIFGGWSAAMTTLIIFMAIDYITGLLVAGVFKASKKSATGGLESHAGFKGLCRKGVILIFVLIGARIDLLIGTSYLKDAVCIGFILNEVISIVENAGLMGIPLPSAVMAAVELLRQKSGEDVEEADNKEITGKEE